jgi:prepilin-type N-terminal cleavage/methylation domain-containing protein
MGALYKTRGGFTLIEMSIVLVIIGLIVGGIMVGQSLIAASQVRATITQVEKFNQAVNTFYGKYGALPGDLNANIAAQFGFTPRGSLPGQGDGNGLIEGNHAGANDGSLVDEGEQGMFWVDLTSANGLNINLINGNFSSATPTTNPGTISGQALDNYLPAAKLGQGNYFYVFSIGFGQTTAQNYFGLSAPASLSVGMNATPGLTVKQAYDIDKKIDDGLPQLGNVRTLFLNRGSGYVSAIWAGTNPAISGNAYTTATPGSTTTCFDNGNAAGVTQQYSLEINSGAGVNCALSFKMQGGD